MQPSKNDENGKRKRVTKRNDEVAEIISKQASNNSKKLVLLTSPQLCWLTGWLADDVGETNETHKTLNAFRLSPC